MGMFKDDIVYGGEPLEPNVTLDTDYILWDCGVVAENVKTSLGEDAVKAEVVVSLVTANGDGFTPPEKLGTFATSIVGKIKKRENGDLPAVVQFQKVPSKQYESDAFVMTFVRKWKGEQPNDPVPEITAIDMQDDIPF